MSPNCSLSVEYKIWFKEIGYNTTDRVCDIVKLIKQQTTFYLWQKYPYFLSKQY